MPLHVRLSMAALLLCAATTARAAVPILGPDDLHPGQKATVRTVFEGQRIEDFDAEIVGVLKGGRVAGDMILARATSERVVRSGIAQGMSGSPVYVDGRLVGALSGGWSFSREPIFSITPIAEMLEVLEQPWPGDAGTGTVGPTGIEPGARSAPGYGGLRWSDPEPAPPAGAPASEAASSPAPAPLPIPVSCVGLAPGALPVAQQIFQPIGLTAVPGGAAPASDTSADLEPGSAVAIELMRGDLQLAAIGTVTWRDGDRVLLFGHPFFQSGAIRLPLATATITTVVSSQLISFKLGSSGRAVGIADQDRRAAVAGRMGPAPRMMPLSVALGGPGVSQRVFRFETIEDRAMAPQLVALATLNSLLESGGLGAGQTVRWTMTAYRRGSDPLVLSETAAGAPLAASLTGGLGPPLAFLYNNPYASLALDSVAVRLDLRSGEDLWTLRGVSLLDAAVRPGGTMRVRCEAERWRGGRRTVDVSLHVPEEVPEGRYLLWAGGGAELNRFEASRLPGRYRPASLDEAWRRIGALRSSDQLYVTLLARAPEVSRDGRDYPELPTSALVLLASGLAAEDAGRRGSQAILDEVSRALGGHVDGEVQLEVTVDPDAP